VIRRATPQDAEAIARVHVATWQFAYADILAPEDLGAPDADERVALWTRIIAGGDPVWVAVEGERIVGFVSIEGNHLTELYVDPIAQGAGVGSALLAQAEAAGARELDVLADNGHAQTFYAARGWRDAGEGEPLRGLRTRRYER
jgi:GNAT superfamily N-acetyltransferase